MHLDDGVLIARAKDELNAALSAMREVVRNLNLEFNEKTQIFPLTHGVEYLGWRFYPTKTGGVCRKLRTHSKQRYKHRLRKLQLMYKYYLTDFDTVKMVLNSFCNHMSYGDTFHLQTGVLKDVVFTHNLD